MKPMRAAGSAEKGRAGPAGGDRAEKENSSRAVERHAVQKLVWLREKDRRRSKGELLKALQHQRIYIDQSAVHYVAPPRSSARADARNSVFKLSQRYTQLSDEEQVKRIRQLFTQVKEEEDSGDDDADFPPSLRKKTEGNRAGATGKDRLRGERVGQEMDEVRQKSSSSSGDRGSGRLRGEEVKVERREGGEAGAAEGHSWRRERENRDSRGAAGGSAADGFSDGKAAVAAAATAAAATAGEEEETAAEDPNQSALEKWLKSHPPTPDEIFAVFTNFGKELDPAAAEGAVSVEVLGDDGLANSFTDIAARELLGPQGRSRRQQGPATPSRRRGAAKAGSVEEETTAAAAAATTRGGRETQEQRRHQQEKRGGSTEEEGEQEEEEKENEDEEEGGDEEWEEARSSPGDSTAPRRPRGKAATVDEQRLLLNSAEVDAVNALQKAFISNSLYTWFEDVRKAYAHGTKLIRVNALGYKFIRLVRVTSVVLTLDPIRAAVQRPQRRISLLAISNVHLGKHSREFAAIRERIDKQGESASNDPPATSCAVLDLPNNRTLSLIFLDEFYRNSFVFFMRVLIERAVAAEKQLHG